MSTKFVAYPRINAKCNLIGGARIYYLPAYLCVPKLRFNLTWMMIVHLKIPKLMLKK